MTDLSPQSTPRLILVYNADSGIINALMHAVHKQLAPETYPCSLCAITYGAVSMRDDWKLFLESLPIKVAIHHKDDFEKAYPEHGIALPAVLIGQSGDIPRTLVSAHELDQMADTADLMEQVEERLVDAHISWPNLKLFAQAP